MQFAGRLAKIRHREVDVAVFQAIIAQQTRAPAQLDAGVGLQAVSGKLGQEVVEVRLAEGEEV
ncbi:MAG: hypothetical protein U0401_26135 [Anaerolineae bacterium]